MTKRDFMHFIIGFGIGALVTWHYAKEKYEKLAQDEIDSVKEIFSKRNTENKVLVNTDADNSQPEKNQTDIVEYHDRLKKAGYIDYSTSGEKSKENTSETPKPYVISPDDFGEDDEYETISLTYYADGVLVDQNDELIENVEATVGIESLNHFGEYEDDSVFVRNERLREDFEILMDQRSYTDIIKQRPHRREDE